MNYQPSNLEDHWIQETMFFWLKFVTITFYYVERFPCILIPETLIQQSSHYNPLYGLPVAFDLRAGCHQRCGASNETGERSGTGQSPSGSLKDTVLDGIEPLRSLPFMYWLFACTFRTFNYESIKLFSMENVYVIYVCILSIRRLHARAI